MQVKKIRINHRNCILDKSEYYSKSSPSRAEITHYLQFICAELIYIILLHLFVLSTVDSVLGCAFSCAVQSSASHQDYDFE